MRPRVAALLAGLVLGAGLVVVLLVTTPWHPLGSTPVGPARWQSDFSAAEHAREQAFHAAVRPPAYLSIAASLLVVVLLGLTPWGSRLTARVAQAAGGRWIWQVLALAALVALVQLVLPLPFDIRVEQVLREHGLSTQSWSSWLADEGKSTAISMVLTAAALLPVVGLARRWPGWWWVPASLGAAALVLVVSFAYPVVVEPLFNKFTPMPQGELRTSLLQLAREDHVAVDDVLVADASRRTTALNAYVSGFGSTKRIVVFDTLLAQATPQEVRLVVAHELGHAKRRDVLHGTLIGALALATLVCLLAAAVGGRVADPRWVPRLLAILALVSFVSTPVANLVSRRIEARADVHSLDLTHDPTTFIASERRLAVTNLSDLDPSPVVYALFATHPTAPERIAMARAWARAHHVELP